MQLNKTCKGVNNMYMKTVTWFTMYIVYEQ